MQLTAEEVAGFLQAQKRVPAEIARALNWVAGGFDVLRWIAPVEFAGTLPASIVLVANRAVARHWSFQVEFRRETVCAWHFKPGTNHKNTGCPDQYPRRVREPHEHLWIEDVPWHCAMPLRNASELSHEEALRAFCERARIAFEPAYFPPPVGEQLTLDPGETRP